MSDDDAAADVAERKANGERVDPIRSEAPPPPGSARSVDSDRVIVRGEPVAQCESRRTWFLRPLESGVDRPAAPFIGR
ncbi:MAG TPA: hypothetical protein DCQ98_08450 [Planctomycetaceae bacterium]|nr:hypothetical protein [Planctomycetaceae bacterium]